jgi:hypothetical protein
MFFKKRTTLFTTTDGSILDLAEICFISPENGSGNTDVWMKNGKCFLLHGGRTEIVKAWKAIN